MLGRMQGCNQFWNVFDKTDPSNYRPISIDIVEIFEKCINQQQHIVEYLEINKIISDRQYGFRESRSTTDLLTLCYKQMESRCRTICALDISKAFDKVWHENLICKIVAYGLDSITIRWMEDRKISVVLNGSLSPSYSPNAEVPQGSVLSPTVSFPELWLWHITAFRSPVNFSRCTYVFSGTDNDINEITVSVDQE